LPIESKGCVGYLPAKGKRHKSPNQYRVEPKHSFAHGESALNIRPVSHCAKVLLRNSMRLRTLLACKLTAKFGGAEEKFQALLTVWATKRLLRPSVR
jgi:hypothetical protein